MNEVGIHPAPVRRVRGALAGVAAVAMSFGLSELVAAILGVPSLIQGIADRVVDSVSPGIKEFAIETFGTNDKLVLLIGIFVVALSLGALLGVLSRRRDQPIVIAVIVVAIVAALATARSAASGQLAPWLLALVAMVAGVTTFRWLMKGRGRHASAEPASFERREILKATSATGLGLVLAGGGRLLGAFNTESATGRDTVAIGEPSTTTAALAAETSFDIPELTPIVVPNEDFYRIDTAIAVPRVAVDTWKLSFLGMVDNPYEITFDELMEEEMVERYVTLSCVSNEVGGGLVGNARWLGVPLSTLVERAQPQGGADQLVGRAVDGFTVGFPTEAVFDGREALVAVAMNGEALPLEHGFPVRLVVAGLYGYVSATKWLSEIELTTWDGFDAYWVPRGWSKEAPIKVQSRIDTPRNSFGAGPRAIAGVAWAPNRGVARVEVSVDGTWKDAELSEPLSQDSWVQWRLDHNFTVGNHEIQVRATDADGVTQGENRVPPAPNGAEGWHTINIDVN